MSAKKSRSKRSATFKSAEKKRVRTVWGSAIGAAIGSLAGSAFSTNPELVSQGVVALQLQFEGQGRSKEQADVIHYIVKCAEGAKGTPPVDVANSLMMLADSIKAGMHVGLADVDHKSILDELLNKNEWVRAASSVGSTRAAETAAPPATKKGRKS